MTLISKTSPFRQAPEERWYILRTMPNGERRAAIELQQIGLRVWVPKRVYLPSPRRQTKPKPRRAPLLVGYILVKFPPRLLDQHRRPQFGIISGCRHPVAGYVTFFDQSRERVPMPISGKTIADLVRRRQQDEFNDIVLAQKQRQERLTELRASMKAGGQVLITTGLYAGRIATLARINDDGSADVKIHLIKRETKLHVEDAAMQIAPLAKSD